MTNSGARWIKSSFSNGSGGNNCVQVASGTGLAGDNVFIKHSKTEHVIAFSRDEWEAFLAGVIAGEFDDI